jgi:hypothetical protein
LSPTEFRPGFMCDSCYPIFSSLCFFFRPLFIIFSFYDWPARLRFMTSDNSFGIYKKKFLICWHIHAPLYYPNYQIYFIVVYMPHYFLWVYSILMQVKTLFITLVGCMLLKWTVKRFELQFQKCYEKIGNLHKTQRSMQYKKHK